MAGRAFPAIYAEDVEGCAEFYGRLGFEEYSRLPPEGEPGFIGMRRGDAELGIATVESPRELVGIEVGSGARFEMFVYVDDVDATVAELREAGAEVLRDGADMPWGERVGWVADPEGNPVALASG